MAWATLRGQTPPTATGPSQYRAAPPCGAVRPSHQQTPTLFCRDRISKLTRRIEPDSDDRHQIMQYNRATRHRLIQYH